MILALFGGLIFVMLESFSAALAWRIRIAYYSRERKSITKPIVYVLGGRSFCEACKTPLSVKSLIPVFGRFFTGGKCPHCGFEIPLHYAFFESIAFVYGFLLALLNPSPEIFLITCLMYPALRIIIEIDHRYMLVPTEALATILIIAFIEMSGLRYRFAFFELQPAFALDLAVAFTWYFLLHLLRLLSKEGLGIADIRLTLALCFSCGFPGSFFLPTLAAILGIIVYLVFRNSHLRENPQFMIRNAGRTRIPFAGFLSLAYLIVRLLPAGQLGI